MTEIKTRATNGDVDSFLENLEDEQKKQDSYTLIGIMEEITGEPAVMWGSSIIGFGTFPYKTKSNKEPYDWMQVGFSPRKAALTLYLNGIMYKMDELPEFFNKLGKYKHGKGCLYIKRLSDVNADILRKLIKLSVDNVLNLSKSQD